MNFIRKGVLLLFCIVLGAFAAIAQQQNVFRHVVQKGETLYRLSRLYDVTVEDIVKLNPELSKDGLKADMEILIPVVKITTESAPQCKEMHKVKKKETLWSISQMYGITVEELKKANPAMFDSDYQLKKGDLVCIPASTGKKTSEPVAVGYDRLKIAVVLPFLSDTPEAERAIEFYRGLLMAVKKMKANGKDIYLFVYDESAYESRMQSLLERIKLQKVQLLIGPLYPQNFSDFSEFSARENLKWLVPFSSKVEAVELSKNLFLMNAPDRYKLEFSANLFVRTFKNNVKVVFLHSADANELTFSVGLRNLLVEKGYEVGDLPENYTLEQMKEVLSADKKTLFVPDASTGSVAQGLLENLKKLRSLVPGSQFALLGYPEWQTFPTDVRSGFYEADTYLFSNHFYNPYSADTRTFEAEYKNNFDSALVDVYPRMALLGYDTGMFWMNGLLKYGKDFSTQDVVTRSLQSDIRFVRVADNGGYVNDCMQYIHYRPDGKVEQISAR